MVAWLRSLLCLFGSGPGDAGQAEQFIMSAWLKSSPCRLGPELTDCTVTVGKSATWWGSDA